MVPVNVTAKAYTTLHIKNPVALVPSREGEVSLTFTARDSYKDGPTKLTGNLWLRDANGLTTGVTIPHDSLLKLFKGFQETSQRLHAEGKQILEFDSEFAASLV